MEQQTAHSYHRLIAVVSGLPGVMSIGRSGGAALLQDGESDIDIFVFCDTIPGAAARREAAETLGNCLTDTRIGTSPGKHWGVCDFFFFGKTEVCVMYYRIAEMDAEIESVLAGSRPDREDNYFYPTGRCASFLTMSILADRQGYIASMQERLQTYPDTLADSLFHYHMDMLSDTEDLERAVYRRDALFYHFALDLAIDHFLQALFALNRRYFPSRKRSLSLMDGFPKQPMRCGERLLRVVALGAGGDTLRQSLEEFASLYAELAALA